MNIFHKSAIFMFILCLIFIPMNVQAAVSIIDDGDFFSESEVQSLENQFANSEHDYYIETLMSLEGQSISQLAYDTMQEVRSEGYSSVVLISNEEGEIYLEVAEETVMDQAIGSASIESILDDTFIPKAIEGQFAEGVEELLTYIESLEIPVEAVESTDQSEEKQDAAPAESATSSSERDSSTSSSTDSEGDLFSVLLLGLLIYAIYLFFKQRKAKKHKTQVLGLQKGLVASLAGPYNKTNEKASISKGKTQTVFEQLNQEIEQLLNKVKEREKELEDLRIPFSRFPKFHNQLKVIEEESLREKEEVETLIAHVDEQANKELETSRQLDQLSKSLDQVDNSLKQLSEETDHSFERLFERQRELSNELARVKKIEDEFDFLTASNQLKGIDVSVEYFLKETDLLKELLEKNKLISLHIEDREKELTSYVERERLILADDDPYALIAEAKEFASRCSALLDQGNAYEANKELDTVENRLNEAMKRVEMLVSYRDETLEKRRQLDNDLKQYENIDEAFSHEIHRLSAKYVSEHWSVLEEEYGRLKQLVEEIHTAFLKIDQWMQLDVQQYKKSFEEITRSLQQFEEIETLYQVCFDKYDQLENHYQSMVNKQNDLTTHMENSEAIASKIVYLFVLLLMM